MAALEATTAARSIAESLGASVVALAVDGPADTDEWSTVGAAGADRLVLAGARPATGRSPAAVADVVASVLAGETPGPVVVPGTDVGNDVAARVSVRLRRPLVEDCIAWRIDADALHIYRPGPDNRHAVRLTTTVEAGPVLVVPPHTVPAREDIGAVGKITAVAVERTEPPAAPVLIGVGPEDRRGLPLDSADVIVAGGRGLGGPDGVELMARLADALGGTVGASRVATDLGWVERDRLIGQTGTTVRPRLYLACGISGASQHVVGMRDSETIIAINPDPNAPIGAVADLLALGEIAELVPAMIAELEESSQ